MCESIIGIGILIVSSGEVVEITKGAKVIIRPLRCLDELLF